MSASLPNAAVAPLAEPDFRAAYLADQLEVRVHTGKLACLLVAALLPAGVLLDLYYYPSHWDTFLTLRLGCSLLVGGVWLLHRRPWTLAQLSGLQLLIVWLPALFLDAMIWWAADPYSGYYAGLNLLLVAVSAVGHWRTRDTVIAAAGVVVMYVGMEWLLQGAGIRSPMPGANPPPATGNLLLNNLCFLLLTSVMVVVGNHKLNALARRAFEARFELDKNRRNLAVANAQLVESPRVQQELRQQNQTLERTLGQLKETELQLIAAEKMASLGRLSAGIIHEINNPLNYMKTGLHLLRSRAAGLPAAQRATFDELSTDLEDGIARVQAIVGALRNFAHPSRERFEFVPLAPVVSVVLKLLSNELKDGVRLEAHLWPDHRIWGNQNKLVQVLLNLVQNAVYAARKKPVDGDGPTVWLESQIVAGWDEIVVRDNGPGIAPEHLVRIFEPFFTTKDVGEGMGLGLSICHRIIQEHHGRIRVQSEPGKFCQFTVEIPRRADAAGPAAQTEKETYGNHV
jgi:two-component system sensor histidine kinase PhcS